MKFSTNYSKFIMNIKTRANYIWISVVLSLVCIGQVRAEVKPLMNTVDINIGESRCITLSDGSEASVKLLDLIEQRDDLRGAIRRAQVSVEVNGKKAWLESGNYNLPRLVGGVQIDCAVTKGYTKNSSKENPWALDADARLRLWPAGSPWIRPGTFVYPLRQKWFTGLC